MNVASSGCSIYCSRAKPCRKCVSKRIYVLCGCPISCHLLVPIFLLPKCRKQAGSCGNPLIQIRKKYAINEPPFVLIVGGHFCRVKPQSEGESCLRPLIKRVTSHLQMPERPPSLIWHAVTSVASGGPFLAERSADFHKGPGGAFLTTSSRSCDVRSCVKSDSPFTLSCLFLSGLVHTTVCVTSVTITSPSFSRKKHYFGMREEGKTKKTITREKMINTLGENNGANSDFDCTACTVGGSLRFLS